MKKKILMLLCVILLVGTFAGCTDTEDTSKSESKPKKEATKKVVVDNDFIKATYLGVKKEYGLVTLNFKFILKQIRKLQFKQRVGPLMILWCQKSVAYLQTCSLKKIAKKSG